MANLTITAANVVPGANAEISTGIAGATITAGQPVYLDSADGRIKVADSNNTAAISSVVGIAVCGASAGQPVSYQTRGTLGIGATVTVGQVYVQSATAGSICPIADLTTGDYVSILGVADTTSSIKMSIFASNIVKP